MSRHQPRPGDHQSVDQPPAHLVALRGGVDRHRPRVGHQTARQTRGDAALERRMHLGEPPPAWLAGHAPLLEHQRDRPARHLQIAYLAAAAVMDPAAGGVAFLGTVPAVAVFVVGGVKWASDSFYRGYTGSSGRQDRNQPSSSRVPENARRGR
ncbi:MAG: hypothetical protein OXH86_16340 [Acidimicrobiaceae bacterium]|nr:hypothetical protein [Acidimicrobiaceae bacterium]